MALTGFKVKGVFDNAVRKKDGSYSLRFITSLVMSSKQVAELLDLCDSEGDILFQRDMYNGEDIPEIKTDDIARKTPSQRLRNVLYVKLRQKLGHEPSNDEFRSYYETKMENIIQLIKNTLDEKD